jgi:glycyl-tRNA synthetase beta chain
VAAQPKKADEGADLEGELYTFITERLRRYFLDRDEGLATETFDAVLARRPASLVDFDRRLDAVQAFIALEPAASLAAANKRIANILRQAEVEGVDEVKTKLLTEAAEEALAKALESATGAVGPLLESRQYTEALTALAELREPVDTFFDDVMVNVEDKATRKNRLALLSQLRALFLDVADISRLSI